MHFSKSKNRRDAEGPWSPGVQGLLPSHGALGPQALPSHTMPLGSRPARTLTQTQTQFPSWERSHGISPADLRTDAFTARPSRSQSFRDPSLKDPALCGIERQRPGSLTSALGGHAPSFPALPRPSASSSFKNHFTLGRMVSTSGVTGPFRAFPKSLSVDFGGLSQFQAPSQHQQQQQQQQQQQPQQQAAGSGVVSTVPLPGSSNNPQDKYAAVSHLDSVFTDPSPATAPPGGPPQYSTLFGNRLSSSSTPASSPGVETASSSQTFANFPNPFSSTSSSSQLPSSSQQPVALSPSNPFGGSSGVLTGDSEAFVTSPTAVFPPSSSFTNSATQNAFALESTNNQESGQANGFASFPAAPVAVAASQPKVPRPMSVNPFTGNVYSSRGTSWNPFI